MGMATGTIASVLALGGYAVEWVSPGEAKRAATHLRNASKLHVEQAVRRRYEWDDGTLPKTAALREHICDAASAVVVAEQGQLARVARSMERASV